MDQPPKRQVSYNQDVILCPDCKKRVRLNNDGLVRKHASSKIGSPECRGSRVSPAFKDQIPGQPWKIESAPDQLFSDIA